MTRASLCAVILLGLMQLQCLQAYADSPASTQSATVPIFRGGKLVTTWRQTLSGIDIYTYAQYDVAGRLVEQMTLSIPTDAPVYSLETLTRDQVSGSMVSSKSTGIASDGGIVAAR